MKRKFLHRTSEEKTISSFFNEQFTSEAIKHERYRAGALAVLFAIGLLTLFKLKFTLISYLPPFTDPRPNKILIIFMAVMMLYEFLLWNVFGWVRKNKKTIPFKARFANAFVEVTSVTFVLFLLSKTFPVPIAVMHTPIALAYFIFIVLSTIRLSFTLSVFTGVVAAVSFIAIALFLLDQTTDKSILVPYLYSPFIFVLKGCIIMLSGFAAAYVAYLIKGSITNSIKNLERQNQVINLFGQQVSKEIVDEMLNKKGSLESKLMKVCVLFIDIRDFSSYAEKHQPEEVVAYQNAFFKIIIETINKHHGVINQFLGDGCMITFGAPLILDNPCENAVRAGREIIERIDEEVKEGILPYTRVGIGIHVGDAVTGNIGTEIRQQYTITGNVVILACRIEQLNKNFNSQLLITHEVKECINGLADDAEEIGAVPVKGREDEVFLYKLA
jgi:adenylate cyclase